MVALNEMGAEVEWCANLPLPASEEAQSQGSSASGALKLAVAGGDRLSRSQLIEAGTNRSEAPTKMSMSLGLSSLSLRMPLPSPGSASPRRASLTGGTSAKGALSFDSPGLTPINANASRSHGVNRALEFGVSTGFNNEMSSNLLDDFLSENVSVSQSNGRGGRRVSFGPSARLSFSSIPGALNDLEDEPHNQPTKLQRTLLGPSSSAEYKSKLRSYVSSDSSTQRSQSRGSLPQPRSKPQPLDSESFAEEDLTEESVEALQLVLLLAEAHRLLHRNMSSDCIRLLHSLQLKQFSSAYVQYLLGLSYFAMR